MNSQEQKQARECWRYLQYMNNLMNMTRNDTLPYMQRLTSGLLLRRVSNWHEKECVKESSNYNPSARDKK